MIDSLDIAEVVRRTGLSSRTLRFYEARGLLQPLRTTSRRRLFRAAELERIQQIVTLKKAGLSLTQIASLIDRKAFDLAAMIEGQLAALDAEAHRLDNARTRLTSLLSRIRTGEQPDVATLCSLIKETECMADSAQWHAVIDRYYTKEEQDDWLANVQPKIDEIFNPDYNAKWAGLTGRIEAALPMDPACDAALDFVRQWFALLEPFSKIATPEMWEGTRQFYGKLPEFENDVDTAFSSRVWLFIREATEIAIGAGEDVGPLPPWMAKPKPKVKGVKI